MSFTRHRSGSPRTPSPPQGGLGPRPRVATNTLFAFGLIAVGSAGINATCGGGTASLSSVEPVSGYLPAPVWNVWEEPYSPQTRSFIPLNGLKKDGTYSLIIELAGIAYEHLGHLYSRSVDASLSTLLRNTSQETSVVDILVVPDERYFRPLDAGERIKHVSVNLAKMRAFENLGESRQSAFLGRSFTYLRTHTDAPFTYGREQFRLEPIRAGAASVAISIWIDHRPVDELTVPICILSDVDAACPEMKPEPSTFAGVDPLAHGKAPDAAIHLIELGPDKIVGVFHKPDEPTSERYLTWVISRPSTWIKDTLTTQITPILQSGAEHYQQAGEALFKMLFYREDPLAGPTRAEEAFREFVNARITAHGSAPGPAGTLFVRLVLQGAPESFPIPFDLLAVGTTGGSDAFLGSHFLVQAPLPLQDYATPSSCLGDWALLVPPATLTAEDYPSMHHARVNLGHWVNDFRKWQDNAAVYEDVRLFDAWLKTSKVASVVVTLSHHYENKLCFENETCSTGDAALAIDVNKPLTSPALAIINGCATARPDSAEFVKEFNRHGASTVIATSTSVEGALAGSFLAALFTTLQEHASDNTYTIGRAKFDAVNTLVRERNDHAPLIYSLLGNGSLRVCVPPKE